MLQTMAYNKYATPQAKTSQVFLGRDHQLWKRDGICCHFYWMRHLCGMLVGIPQRPRPHFNQVLNPSVTSNRSLKLLAHHFSGILGIRHGPPRIRKTYRKLRFCWISCGCQGIHPREGDHDVGNGRKTNSPL